MSKFIDLLDALENAVISRTPFNEGYGDKRKAVLEYVAKLERIEAETIERCALACEERARIRVGEDGWDHPGSANWTRIHEAKRCADTIRALTPAQKASS